MNYTIIIITTIVIPDMINYTIIIMVVAVDVIIIIIFITIL